MDYVHLERTTGKAIADAIVKSLHDMGFDIKNLRGQGYDGACCCLPTPMTLASGGSPMELLPCLPQFRVLMVEFVRLLPWPYIPIARAMFSI